MAVSAVSTFAKAYTRLSEYEEHLTETRIPEAAQLRADADIAAAVATERRFHAIEDSLLVQGLATEQRQNNILTAIQGLTDTVNRQNSRVGKLEEWRTAAEKAQAYTKGIVEGGAKLGGRQLAFLAVVGPLIFAGVGFVIRIWT